MGLLPTFAATRLLAITADRQKKVAEAHAAGLRTSTSDADGRTIT